MKTKDEHLAELRQREHHNACQCVNCKRDAGFRRKQGRVTRRALKIKLAKQKPDED